MVGRAAIARYGLALWLSLAGSLCASPGVSVVLTGLDRAQEQAVRQALGVQALRDKPLQSVSRLRFLHQRAADEIKLALQPFGLYRAEVDSDLQLQDEQWQARYQIKPGPAITIATLDIAIDGDAQNDPLFARLLMTSPLKQGQALLHADYEQLKSQLQSLAAERGYYRADFSRREIAIDLKRYRADIRLHFDSGPRFHIADIRFSPSPLDEDFLRRYLTFADGDAVQNSDLLALQTALIDSDYFQRVEVSPLWDQAIDNRVPIQVDLQAQNQTRYLSGLGYGTDTGARAKLGARKHWLNGRGHQFNSQALLSQIRSNFSSQYSIPGWRPQLDRYALQFSANRENSDSVDARNYSLGVSWQQQGRWQQVYALDWQQESFTFSHLTEKTGFLMPKLSWTRVAADNRLKVRDGYRLSLELLAASEALLSETDFIQLRMGAKGVYAWGERWRLIARADGGYTDAAQFDLLPATLRFYAGGHYSVRGYDYQSLGPRDSSGSVIGGSRLLVASAEVDYRIGSQWGLALFVDQGDAFDASTMDLHRGQGFGLRWFSPVGPLRLDLAWPQDRQESGFRLHFSLGPDL